MIKIENNRIFWEIFLLWSIWLLLVVALTNSSHYIEVFYNRAISSLIGFLIIIPINARYLFPKLYLQKKQLLYVIASIVLLSSTILIMYHEIFPWSDWLRSPPPPKVEVMNAQTDNSSVRWMKESIPMLLAFLGSTLIGIIRFANKKEKEAIHSKNEKLETELKFLKSQVNPHFLFNALNNIYSLSVLQAPQTSESIMQLSEILRYMVYDSNEDKVPLNNEIKYIENFVELKLLKDSRGMDVQIDLDKSSSDLRIAPLLFIPFVENAFKHSKIESLEEGYVKINLRTNENKIEFYAINNVPTNKFTKDKVGGVGLKNIKKRLHLLYPGDQHELKINEEENRFEVILKITT